MTTSRFLIVTLLVIAAFALWIVATSRDEARPQSFGYWANDGWIELELIPDIVAARFVDVDTPAEVRSEVAKTAGITSTDDWLAVHGIAIMRLHGDGGLKRIRNAVDRLAENPRIAYAVPVFRHGTVDLISGDELILQFHPSVTPERIAEFLREQDLVQLAHRTQLVEYYHVRWNGGQGIELLELAERLRDHNLLKSISPNFVQMVSQSPRDAHADPASVPLAGAGRAASAALPPAMPRPDDDELTPVLDMISPLAPNAGTWTEVMIQGFESPHWQSGWRFFSDPEPPFPSSEPVEVPEAHWARSSTRRKSGEYSAWCAQSALEAGITDGSRYLNNMHAWMVYGPFSLWDATWAQLRFRIWNDTALSDPTDYFPLDLMEVLFSTDGINFRGASVVAPESRPYADDSSHWFDGWFPHIIDLTTLEDLGDLTEHSTVWLAFRFRSGASVTAMGTNLDDIQLVKARPLSRRPISNDPFSQRQWGLRNIKQSGGTVDADIGAATAWELSPEGHGVVVAVLDTGVDLDHEDLSLVPGYDAVNGGRRTGEGTRGGPQDRGAFPGDGHGTACAGVIAAIRDNERGVAGVAPRASIMPVRIGHDLGMRGIIVTETLWIIDAISWAVDEGAHVMSASWHIGPESVLSDVIDVAVNDRGVVMLFSTGNFDLAHRLEEPPIPPGVPFPANLPDVIAVGASSPCDERVSFDSCDFYPWESGHGQHDSGADRWPDVVAPGVMIHTTDITGPDGYDPGDYFANFDGTSAAVPHVAGVVALMLSLQPTLDPETVKEIIMATARDIDTPGPDRFTGAGRVDAAAALEETMYRLGLPAPSEEPPL